MIDFDWLNVGSLVLGLIAWILPIYNLIPDNKQKNKLWVVFSLISISACAISLCFQIIYNYHLVNIKDWTALMDTIGVVAFSSALLLIVTIILNALTLIKYRERTAK